ncbi:MAG: glutamine-hydrolyzing GMP synthase [Acidimicrobiaceae bacterium]|nr:glutamine-hydrolyzing GMP synthase [Acidimicrobiaceae bacterium]
MKSISDQMGVVLIVDFGAQYSHLIARRVREAGVYSEIIPPSSTAAEIAARHPIGIILSGGPASVYVPNSPRLNPQVYELGIPILGVCYGAQLMAQQLGGTVARNTAGEYGCTDMTLIAPSFDNSSTDRDSPATSTLHAGGLLLADLESPQTVWMSHADCVVEPPEGMSVIAQTAETPVAAFEDRKNSLYAVQFHPEVTHTPCGQIVVERFLRDVCGSTASWSTHCFIETSMKTIKTQLGEEVAICGLSGGVDSAVAATLVEKAVGSQLTCVLVDTGLLRLDEAEQVIATFQHHTNIRPVKIDAGDRFFEALAGISDPEIKRKTVGETFIRVFEEARQNIAPNAKHLVQGTLYPDVIESGTAHAATIKSHHNVGGLPEDMDFELLEPLRWLFKDEVRSVGTELGLPDELVYRQPFPGPGLAVRIIGEITPGKAEILRQADAVVREELKSAELMGEIWQAFAVLMDIRSVGVMGDQRTYGYPIAIRAVTGSDAMTADWARLPHTVLAKISNRIVNEVHEVNRVVYDITSKPPATIEWE